MFAKWLIKLHDGIIIMDRLGGIIMESHGMIPYKNTVEIYKGSAYHENY